MEFDATGDYLATGDKGGRVVLFERNEGVRFSLFPLWTLCLIQPCLWFTELGILTLFGHLSGTKQKKGCEYKFFTEFQSHEPEFDYLKSLEIEEKINKIRWCRRQNAAHFLLSTNGL